MMMLRPLFRSFAVILLLGLAGCPAYLLVPESSASAAGMQVQVDAPWNKVNQLAVQSSGAVEVWTADGLNLNMLVFIGGAKDGEPVLHRHNVNAPTKAPAPIFRSSMAASEIVELWEAVMAQISNTTIAKGSNIQPVKFGGLDGFQFDFSYATKDEVDRQGVGYGAVKDKKLYLVFYSGTKLHHYNLRLASATKIMQSAKIGG